MGKKRREQQAWLINQIAVCVAFSLSPYGSLRVESMTHHQGHKVCLAIEGYLQLQKATKSKRWALIKCRYAIRWASYILTTSLDPKC